MSGTQVAANSWGVVTPETSRLPKVTGTHRGSCSSGEANGTLQGMEGGTHLELSGATSSPSVTQPPSPTFTHPVSRVSLGARVSRKNRAGWTLGGKDQKSGSTAFTCPTP